jgi:ribonucleoside-diphosphate reductase alpha chain
MPDTARKRLPNRRGSESFELTAAGLNYRATVSRFEDGRVAEIFLSNHKIGSHADTAARDSAVVCSIALQFGVPIETIRRALMRDSHGRPNGPPGVVLDLLATDKAKTP